MEQISSLEANSCSAREEIFRLSWTQMSITIFTSTRPAHN